MCAFRNVAGGGPALVLHVLVQHGDGPVLVQHGDGPVLVQHVLVQHGGGPVLVKRVAVLMAGSHDSMVCIPSKV